MPCTTLATGCTIRGAFHALRSLFEYLVTTKVLDPNTAQDVRLPKKDAAKRLLISDKEMHALFEAAERQSTSREVAFSSALLMTLAGTAVRSDELVNMMVEDVRLEREELYVRHEVS